MDPSLPVSTEVYCAVGFFQSSRTYGHPSAAIRYFNKITLAYTLQSSCSFFEQYNIPLESHPPYSPVLNPIEHAWVLFKRQVHIDYPWIGDYPGGPREVKKKLAEILPLCREKIPPKQFEALWKSMPDRVQAVIEARGGTLATNFCISFLLLSLLSICILMYLVV